MPQYKVEGTYRTDRGHEHEEPKPHKFSLTVSANDRADARRVTELEIKKTDDQFDSLRKFTAEVIVPPAVEENLQTPVEETPVEETSATELTLE